MQALADQVTGSHVHGFVAEANDIELTSLPDALVTAAGGRVAISVTHHRVKGAAWGQYVIFYLFVPAAPGAPNSTDT